MRTLPSLCFAGFLVTVLALDVAARGDEPQLDVELVADGLVAPVDLTSLPTAAIAASSWTRPGWSSS